MVSIIITALIFILPVQVQAASEQDFFTAVEDVAKKVGPAVVSIKTERTERYRTYSNGFGGSPYHDEFFNRFFEDFFGGSPQFEQRRQGLGSGVIIDKEGYILTNEHVVVGADRITVVLPDGRSFKGELKGTDPRSDLAVIKVTAADLPVATLGDSEQLRIGQWVVAIGNPFGHVLADPEPTVTSGVVSALHRSLPNTSMRDTDYSDLIQTDAAINPGNSGGPLVNLKGEVVGINVAIFSTTGGYQGIGFAIPANYAKIVVEQLIKGKKVVYGWVGIGIQDLNYQLSQYFQLPSPDGVLIEKIMPGGPAESAGLKEGDIILEADGVKIRNSGNLIKYIGTAAVGKKVSLKILRDGKSMEVPVIVGTRPSFNEEMASSSEPTAPGDIPQEPQEWRGISVREIPEAIRSRANLQNVQGVIIFDIQSNSSAQDAGLQKGDIIIAINKNPVTSILDFNRITHELKGSCLIRTLRGYFVIPE
jgi:serine protease Do